MNKKEWQNKGQGHRGRLRDRFLERGLANFTDKEVVELLLTMGTPRKDCKEEAKELLKKFGSFSAVLEASSEELQTVKGIGSKNSIALHLIKDVADRYLQQRLHGKRYLHSSSDVADYLVHSMKALKIEIFKVIFLDSSHGIIASETVTEGTINVNTVYPREVIKSALKHNAAALIIAHNHPSGSLSPSEQDLALTKSLFSICYQLQISLLDHFIIGDGYYSFADHGLMAEIKESIKS